MRAQRLCVTCEAMSVSGGRTQSARSAAAATLDDRRMRLRQRVDARPRQRQDVALQMAEAAVADQVDDDVGAETRPPGRRDRRGTQACSRLVGVHARDRRVDHARTSVQYCAGQALIGLGSVKPTWLLMITCTVPPTV